MVEGKAARSISEGQHLRIGEVGTSGILPSDAEHGHDHNGDLS